MLLSREEFRTKCMKRDKNRCVLCFSTQDLVVHHIIERKLFSDGGYYIDNGATLCPDCHIKAETTEYSVEFIREKCGISNKILPEHLYIDQIYDKWGNPILPNGRRMIGELFYDISVQKILGNYLNLFTKYVKYPRTYHLPWSPGASDDDRIIKSTDIFKDKEVVVTVKMDGENTTMYNDYIHARSINDKKHWSKNWIKNFHANIKNDIPEDMRIVGENLYAKHSIKYSNLKSYFYGFSIWDKNKCLSWKDTLDWFNLLNIVPVPVLYYGKYNEELIKNMATERYNEDELEGYVIRLAEDFTYGNFSKSVAKFVRANHIASNQHWFYGKAGEINNVKLY